MRKQRSWGGSLQWVFKQPLFGLKNQFAAGLDYDHGRVNYTAVVEASDLIVVDNLPLSSLTRAECRHFHSRRRARRARHGVTAGVYATDTLSLTDRLALTVSARYNHTHARHRSQRRQS